MSGGGGHGGGGLSFPFLHELHEWMESTNGGGGFIIPGQIIIGMGVLIVFLFNQLAPLQSLHNWGLAFTLGPLWIPLTVGRFAMMRFLHLKRSWFNFKNEFVLLELLMPREVLKSPQAMDTVFASMNINPGEGTWLKKYWWGRSRPWWSLEIVSLSGQIHFYIYVRKGMRHATETFFYAQYPEIQIIEAKDYSRMRDPSKAPYSIFACEFNKQKEGPYPIKTYVDYGLDKPTLKVEMQIDPLAQMLELFGSIGPGEEIWVQYIVRVAKSEKYRAKKNASGGAYTWKDEAKEIIESIRARVINPVSGFPNPTEVDKDTMAAVERNVSKLVYDVGIRAIYSAPKDQWKSMNPFVANMFKPVNTAIYNSIMPIGHRWSEKFNDYPWEDIGGHRQRFENKEVVEFYRYRSMFHPPYRGEWMHMSTEELATIFHFPSSIVKTPNLPRITSSTSAPPSNLPQ